MTVYAIKNDRGQVKIGFTSRSANNRVAELPYSKHAVGMTLTVIGEAAGTRDDERALHARFAAHRVVGEWFTLAPEIEAWISTLNPAAPAVRDRVHRVRLTVPINDDLSRALKVLAAADKRTLSHYVELLLLKHVERQEKRA